MDQWGKHMPAAVGAARARSLRRQKPAWWLVTTAWQRVRELGPWAGVARAVAQVAREERRRSVERAGVSGRHQRETREEAAGGASEHEGGRWGNASTIGEGADARIAEGRASASTLR